MTRKQLLPWFAPAFALVLAIAFALKTGLLSGGWYSADLNFRYQTNGFFHGSLRVQPSPINHHHDWAWADGMHQIWGLGVPLLRFPFEFLAAVFGAGFPDRIVFLFYYSLTAIVIVSATGTVGSPLFRAALAAAILANPSWQTLVGGTEFPVYEEAIAYNALWAILTFFIALRALETDSRSGSWCLLAALLAGFSPLLRPTGLLYGLLNFSLIFFFATKQSFLQRLKTTALFCASLSLTPLTNYARFNSALSYGHELSLTNQTGTNYALRFGHPFQFVPFFTAFREQLGYLYSSALGTAWRADAYRYRITAIPLHFGWVIFAYLALMFLLTLLFIGRRRKNAESVCGIMMLWSTLAIVPLFVFYAKLPFMQTRYFGDLFPAVYVGLSACAVWGARKNPIVASLFLGVFLLWSLLAQIPGNRHPANLTRPDLESRLPPWSSRMPLLPDEYFCGMKDPQREIGYNTVGWELRDDCSVHDSLLVFFDDPDCVALGYEGTTSGTIRVLDQLEELRPSSTSTKNGRTEVVFCPTKHTRSERAYKYSSIHLLAFGLIKPQDLSLVRKPPMRLLFVRKAKRAD